jgi:hypothetical protein
MEKAGLQGLIDATSNFGVVAVGGWAEQAGTLRITSARATQFIKVLTSFEGRAWISLRLFLQLSQEQARTTDSGRSRPTDGKASR